MEICWDFAVVVLTWGPGGGVGRASGLQEVLNEHLLNE